jgi:hypothetical protein
MSSYSLSNNPFSNHYNVGPQRFNPNFQRGGNGQGYGVQNSPQPPFQGGQSDSFQFNGQDPFGLNQQGNGQGFPPPPPGGPRGPQGGQRPNPEAMFSQLDTDGDGSLTQKEMQAGRPDNAPAMSTEQEAEMFSHLDADGDGSLSLEEMQNAPPPPPPPQFNQRNQQNFSEQTSW